ncbi:unnamed protein product [Gongylonema pulchrum]|uniref:Uncharacterized protein n=1 Tax=Gongylonema pulchrum TaxID=637853 RepID=A0A183EN48_9BILA|nr:unnamed protein product [Gongylonema pulchrum]
MDPKSMYPVALRNKTNGKTSNEGAGKKRQKELNMSHLTIKNSIQLDIGSCAIYEATTLRHRLHFTYVGFRLVSVITDLYVIKHARGLNIIEKETNDDSIATETYRP